MKASELKGKNCFITCKSAKERERIILLLSENNFRQIGNNHWFETANHIFVYDNVSYQTVVDNSFIPNNKTINSTEIN